MNLFKSTVAATAIITCCLGNEMPAKADVSTKIKLETLKAGALIVKNAVALQKQGDNSQLCPAMTKVEILYRPYNYFGKEETFGPTAVQNICSKVNQLNQLKSQTKAPTNTILSECRAKWGTNYRMVKYCVEKQSAAKRALGL